MPSAGAGGSGHRLGRDEARAEAQRLEFRGERGRQAVGHRQAGPGTGPPQAAGIRASTMPANQLDPNGIASSSKS